MPTIISLNGFNIVIFTNDHEPMHVHVFRGHGRTGGKAKITLEPTVALVDSRNMTSSEERSALEIVVENYAVLANAWKEIHG